MPSRRDQTPSLLLHFPLSPSCASTTTYPLVIPKISLFHPDFGSWDRNPSPARLLLEVPRPLTLNYPRLNSSFHCICSPPSEATMLTVRSLIHSLVQTSTVHSFTLSFSYALSTCPVPGACLGLGTQLGQVSPGSGSLSAELLNPNQTISSFLATHLPTNH